MSRSKLFLFSIISTSIVSFSSAMEPQPIETYKNDPVQPNQMQLSPRQNHMSNDPIKATTIATKEPLELIIRAQQSKTIFNTLGLVAEIERLEAALEDVKAIEQQGNTVTITGTEQSNTRLKEALETAPQEAEQKLEEILKRATLQITYVKKKSKLLEQQNNELKQEFELQKIEIAAFLEMQNKQLEMQNKQLEKTLKEKTEELTEARAKQDIELQEIEDAADLVIENNQLKERLKEKTEELTEVFSALKSRTEILLKTYQIMNTNQNKAQENYGLLDEQLRKTIFWGYIKNFGLSLLLLYILCTKTDIRQALSQFHIPLLSH